MMLVLLAAASAQTTLPGDARFALALYCNPTCSDEVLTGLDDDLATIKARSGFSEVMTKPGRIMGIAGTDFGIPDQDFINAYGVDVDQPEALMKSEQVVLVWFAAPRAQAVETLAMAHAAFTRAAESSGGWVEDLDTQRIYGKSAWASLDPRGSIENWFIIDGDAQDPANPEGNIRLLSRGLRRYGNPELVVEDIPPDLAGDVAYIMNTVAMAIHEQGWVGSTLKVSTETVEGTATFTTIPRREDDPEDPILKLNFDGAITEPVAPGTVVEAVPLETVAALDTPAMAIPMEPTPPVAPAPVQPAAPPRTLAEAQAQALARLDTTVRSAFVQGLPPGDVVAVQVPWKTATGNSEYLWFELESWDGTTMRGRLATRPFYVKDIRQGEVVAFSQEQVFDYVWKHADGSREGGTTQAFLQQR